MKYDRYQCRFQLRLPAETHAQQTGAKPEGNRPRYYINIYGSRLLSFLEEYPQPRSLEQLMIREIDGFLNEKTEHPPQLMNDPSNVSTQSPFKETGL